MQQKYSEHLKPFILSVVQMPSTAFSQETDEIRSAQHLKAACNACRRGLHQLVALFQLRISQLFSPTLPARLLPFTFPPHCHKASHLTAARGSEGAQ